MISEEIASVFCLWIIFIYLIICSTVTIINNFKDKYYISIFIISVLNIVVSIAVVYVTGFWLGWWELVTIKN